jgi:hypothetical protein
MNRYNNYDIINKYNNYDSCDIMEGGGFLSSFLPTASGLYWSIAPVYLGLFAGYSYGKNGKLSGLYVVSMLLTYICLGLMLIGLSMVKFPVVMVITWSIPLIMLLILIIALFYYLFKI